MHEMKFSDSLGAITGEIFFRDEQYIGKYSPVT